MPTDLRIQSSEGIARVRERVSRVWLIAAGALALALMLAARVSDSTAAERLLPVAALGVMLTATPRFGRLMPILAGVGALVVAIASGTSFRDSTGSYLVITGCTVVLVGFAAMVAARTRDATAELDKLVELNDSMGIRDAVESALAGGRRFNYIQREIARAARYKRDLTIAIAAIDNLHLLRAERGEAEVQAALATLGELFSKDTRLPDGGISDELSLIFLLPETPLMGGRVVVERVRLAFQSLNIIGAHGVPLTASAGLVSCWDDTLTADELTTAAQAALAHAQALGGNRTVMAHGPADAPASWVMPGGAVIDDGGRFDE